MRWSAVFSHDIKEKNPARRTLKRENPLSEVPHGNIPRVSLGIFLPERIAFLHKIGGTSFRDLEKGLFKPTRTFRIIPNQGVAEGMFERRAGRAENRAAQLHVVEQFGGKVICISVS